MFFDKLTVSSTSTRPRAACTASTGRGRQQYYGEAGATRMKRVAGDGDAGAKRISGPPWPSSWSL